MPPSPSPAHTRPAPDSPAAPAGTRRVLAVQPGRTKACSTPLVVVVFVWAEVEVGVGVEDRSVVVGEKGDE